MLAYVVTCLILLKIIDSRVIVPQELSSSLSGYEEPTLHDVIEARSHLLKAVPESPVQMASDDAVLTEDRYGLRGSVEHPCPSGYVMYGGFCVEELEDRQGVFTTGSKDPCPSGLTFVNGFCLDTTDEDY